ncbi:MAG TPA: LysR substrate-binding domain-containing protein [Xanthomonadaceae bacterium]|nr:LysR substrate-binding domain-containing protein [Xanthomonadaceae bacterium]
MALRSDWLPALAAFEAAARHQNFAHAAEELHLTASAISHHVRRLEARLGTPLFLRHARGVALTAPGRQLADAAGSALADVESTLRGLRAGRDGEPPVRIAALHSWTCSWLLPRLPSFSAAHPDIAVSIETGFALARFDDGGPDLGIRHGGGEWPGLAAQLLFHEEMFPVASPSLPGVDALRTPEDIARAPLIGDAARQGWPDWFRHAGVRATTVRERFRFSDSNAGLIAASLGLGVALARERIVAPFLADGRLRRLPGPALRGRFSYYLIHPTHRRLRPPAQAFADWLLAQPRE